MDLHQCVIIAHIKISSPDRTIEESSAYPSIFLKKLGGLEFSKSGLRSVLPVFESGRMVEFVATPAGKPFSGVFSKLGELCHGNPFDAGAISITSPTSCHNEYPLRNLVEYTTSLDKCFWNFAHVDPSPEQSWLLFDLQDRRLAMTAYTLRSGGSSHPKSWRMLGSNDGTDWTLLSEVTGCRELNGPKKTETFPVEEKGPFRLFKYEQLENLSPKPDRKFRINLRAVEFFGSVYH
jgi:hypothetical protein